MAIRQIFFRGGKAGWQSLLPALLLLLIASSQASAALVDLGANVSPTDINNAGTIVGSRVSDSGTVAFRWPAGGLIEDIPGATVANAVNDLGQVTGNTPNGAFVLDGGRHDWAGYGGYGINESGQISGNKALNNPYRPTPLPLDPAIYTLNKWDNLGIASVYSRGTRKGVYADLYVLDDINDTGYAVGSRRRYGLVGSSSILTTPDFGEVTYLPIPYQGYAKAINNQNKIVGAAGSSASDGKYAHAYLYDYSADSFQDLGTLNGGLTSSAADINEHNQVVGSSWLVTQLTSVYDPSLYHAFVWQAGAMSDLNDQLPAGSGWILTAATAINDNGDIVGTGLKDGIAHGFLLTTGAPPPPSENQAPLAVASADVAAGKAPLTVNFSSEGSSDPDGNIAGYAWDFGDGNTSNAQSPSNEYTVTGNYTAVLTVTDDDGSMATAQVEITVRKSKGRR